MRKICIIRTLVGIVLTVNSLSALSSPRWYDSSRGLSDNTVYDAVQDSDGCMWFCTRDGINRFGGRDFSCYGSAAQGERLRLTRVVMHRDGKRMWTASSDSLYIFTPSSGTFECFNGTTPDGHGIFCPHDMVYDSRGSLYVCAESGLFRISPNGGLELLFDGHILTCSISDAEVVYFMDGPRFFRLPLRKKNASAELLYSSSMKIAGVKVLDSRRVFLALENGQIYIYDTAEENMAPVGKVGRIGTETSNSVSRTDEGRFILCTNEGIFIFDPETKSIRKGVFGCDRDNVNACIKDREDGIWICSYYKGTGYVSTKTGFIETLLPGRVISGICEDSSSGMWIATENEGLYHYDRRRSSVKKTNISVPQDIRSLLSDGSSLWVGTNSYGLFRYETSSGRLENFKVGGEDSYRLGANSIFSILRDKDADFLWLGTLNGLYRFYPERNALELEDRIGMSHITDIHRDEDGFLWVASRSDGLWKQDGGEWIHFCESDGVVGSDKITKICSDKSGNLWISTEDAGLFKYSSGVFVSESRLPRAVYYGFLEDSFGRFWIPGNKGIVCYDPQAGKNTLLSANDGLQKNQFNYNALLETSDGRLWFGGFDGLNSLYPSEYVPNEVVPVVSISRIAVGSSDTPAKVGEDGVLRLTHKDKYLRIKFDCFSYENPDANSFRWKMEGFSDEWTVTDENQVSFTGLRPGRYLFVVEGCNNDGVWCEKGDMLKLEVKAHPLASDVALVVYIMLLLLCVAWIIYYYVRKSNERRERRTMEEKMTFFTQVAHEIKTPLALIKAPIEKALEQKSWSDEMEEDLSIADRNVLRLTTLIRELLDFSKMDSGKFKLSKSLMDLSFIVRDTAQRMKVIRPGVTLAVDVPDTTYINADAEAMTKVVSNLLSNAFRYAEMEVSVRLYREDKRVVLDVWDDGIPIPSSEQNRIFETFYQADKHKSGGFGLGLSLVKSIVDMHEGSVRVGETERGCSILVSLPEAEGVLDIREAGMAYDAGRKTVLLVEDNDDMRRFLRENFASSYNVLVAGNGQEALNLLYRNEVDIVVSDLMMPVMDGLELVRTIRSDEILRHVPVLILSAKGDTVDRLTGLEYGVDAYLEKPFDLKILLLTVSNIIETRTRLMEKFSLSPDSDSSALCVNSKDNELLTRINAKIMENISNPDLGVDFLMNEIGISRSNLQKKIKGVTGMSTIDYIHLIRLKEAARLFRQGNDRVNEVCYHVGFSTPSYFAKCFARQFGESPKDYAIHSGAKKTIR